jgi:hypothetical protein
MFFNQLTKVLYLLRNLDPRIIIRHSNSTVALIGNLQSQDNLFSSKFDHILMSF